MYLSTEIMVRMSRVLLGFSMFISSSKKKKKKKRILGT